MLVSINLKYCINGEVVGENSFLDVNEWAKEVIAIADRDTLSKFQHIMGQIEVSPKLKDLKEDLCIKIPFSENESLETTISAITL